MGRSKKRRTWFFHFYILLEPNFRYKSIGKTATDRSSPNLGSSKDIPLLCSLSILQKIRETEGGFPLLLPLLFLVIVLKIRQRWVAPLLDKKIPLLLKDDLLVPSRPRRQWKKKEGKECAASQAIHKFFA